MCPLFKHTKDLEKSSIIFNNNNSTTNPVNVFQSPKNDGLSLIWNLEVKTVV